MHLNRSWFSSLEALFFFYYICISLDLCIFFFLIVDFFLCLNFKGTHGVGIQIEIGIRHSGLCRIDDRAKQGEERPPTRRER